MKPFPVVIVGTGRMGGALAGALRKKRWPVSVVAHSAASVRAATRRDLPLASEAQLAAAVLVLVCVPDARIGAVASALRPTLGRHTALVHCAGASTLDVLGAEGPRGSFHPLCAVSSPLDSLAGASVALSATSPTLLRRLRGLADVLALSPLIVPESGRAAYHAGAMLSAGGVVSALEAAVEAFVHAGVEVTDALPALLELAKSALRGVEARGLREGLTGPVVRGESETLTRHLRALPAALHPVYRALVERSIVLRTPDLTVRQVRALRAALRE